MPRFQINSLTCPARSLILVLSMLLQSSGINTSEVLENDTHREDIHSCVFMHPKILHMLCHLNQALNHFFPFVHVRSNASLFNWKITAQSCSFREAALTLITRKATLLSNGTAYWQPCFLSFLELKGWLAILLSSRWVTYVYLLALFHPEKPVFLNAYSLSPLREK